MSAVERGCGVGDVDTAEREFGAGEFGAGEKGWRHGDGGHFHCGQRLLGSIQFADEELASGSDQAGVEGIGMIAEGVERFGGGIELIHAPGEITSSEGDLGFSDLATRLSETFARTKAMRGAAQEFACSLEITELRHGNAAQRERRRIIAQCNALERAERITGRQQSRRRGDERVHGRQDNMDAWWLSIAAA